MKATAGIAALLGILVLPVVHAQDPVANPCKETKPEIVGATNWYTVAGTTSCLVNITPASPGNAYRSYSTSNRGVLMISNSYDPHAKTSVGTGARTFFIFPRIGVPSAKKLVSGELEVKTASGETFRIDPSVPKMVAGGTLTPTEDPRVNKTNAGGVELQLASDSSSVLLDTGFRVGSIAYGNPNGSSKFIDSQGHSCSVTNSEIFSYTNRWDPPFLFATDTALAGFLKKRCPTIRLDGLLHAALNCPDCK